MTEPFLYLKHPLFDATILRQGAQLIHFQPHGKKPFLWHADVTTYQKGKAFRGGIPICWPWFGKAAVPSHGFARLVEWTLSSQKESDEGVELHFELKDSAFTKTVWPYAFCATLIMKLGNDIRMEFLVDAKHTSTVALHTYFACSNIHDVRIQGLGSCYQDALQEGLVCEESSASLSIAHAVDRIYTEPKNTLFIQEGDQTVTLHQEYCSDAVVWNPWEEGSRTLSDMHAHDYTRMLCVESARICRPFEKKDHLFLQISSE